MKKLSPHQKETKRLLTEKFEPYRGTLSEEQITESIDWHMDFISQREALLEEKVRRETMAMLKKMEDRAFIKLEKTGDPVDYGRWAALSDILLNKYRINKARKQSNKQGKELVKEI